MDNYMQSLVRPACLLFLAAAAVSAQTMAPAGSFGFLVNASYDDPSSNNGLALRGVMNFDGAGNVTGSYTSESGATDTQAAQTNTASFTGTYSSNPDGTGSLTITNDSGTSLTFAMVIADGGQGLLLAMTNLGGGGSASHTAISGVARAAYVGGPMKGSYAAELTNTPAPAGTALGVLTFDGAGNVTLSATFVGGGESSTQPSVQTKTYMGTYTSNPDGSGAINLGNPAPFVITDGGSGALVLLTNQASGVTSGIARRQ